jgi:hypothetical protein
MYRLHEPYFEVAELGLSRNKAFAVVADRMLAQTRNAIGFDHLFCVTTDPFLVRPVGDERQPLPAL